MSPAFDLSEWYDMMASSVSIYPWISNTVSGVPVYGATATVYQAYIRMQNHLILDHLGREITARGKVFLGGSVASLIGVRDKIVMPAGTVPLSPPILGVDASNDENGLHHVVIHIG